MTVAKRMYLLLLLNVATHALSGVTLTSSPTLSPSSPASSEAGAERSNDVSLGDVGGDSRAFYYYNGTAMVNTTTVAITFAFYSVIALGIYSLVAGAAAEQMADFIEVSEVGDAFKVTADAALDTVIFQRQDKESIQGDFTEKQDSHYWNRAKQYEGYSENHALWGQESMTNQLPMMKKSINMFERG